ncbi:MAG: cysteine desulfurase [Candidatus Omnitrophica bacterium]|nr:cysteine desulfurase [Candidatus Omnitrophota bacterium]
MNMAFDVKRIREDFPNLAAQGRDAKPIVYFDNAATTFKPCQVIALTHSHYCHRTANIHRGVHYLSEVATAEYESTREKVRRFLNARSLSEIIFTKGATESINLVAASYGRKFLKSGDEVIISQMEHHSNIVPWQMLREETGCVLRVVPISDAGELMLDEYRKLLGPRTKLVAMVHVSNSLGTVNPVKDIIKEAHSAGAVVLIDAAQGVTHEPVDVQLWDADFVVFSGHKMFGPTGVGVLYGKERLLESMPPYQGGGDMILSVDFDKTIYNRLPHKFEAGTPNVAGVIGLGAAIDYMNSLSWAEVIDYKKDLLQHGTKLLSTIPDLRMIGSATEKAPIFSFTLRDIHAHDIGTLLDREGFAIRTGHHCTQPVMKRFGIPATSRASLAFYNTREELEAFAVALKKVVEVFK